VPGGASRAAAGALGLVVAAAAGAFPRVNDYAGEAYGADGAEHEPDHERAREGGCLNVEGEHPRLAGLLVNLPEHGGRRRWALVVAAEEPAHDAVGALEEP
jgi:hypothetical protein